MATERCQQVVCKAIEDCPGAFCMSDNVVVVVGNTQEDHDTHLAYVKRKLNKHGIAFTAIPSDACELEPTWIGHLLTCQGLSECDEKAMAVIEARPPKDIHEVRSFLGLAQLCEKYIPEFLTITKPLWNLAAAAAAPDDDTDWNWTEVEEAAFTRVKFILTSASVLARFSHDFKTRILTSDDPQGKEDDAVAN